MGVAGPEQLGPATQYIADRGMACSVFCANFLIDALYDGGRAADAVRLMTDTGQRAGCTSSSRARARRWRRGTRR